MWATRSHEQGRQRGHGVAARLQCGSLPGGSRRRALKPGRLSQGAVVPTRQKAPASVSSAPTTADTAAHSSGGNTLPAGCRAAGCALLLHQHQPQQWAQLWECARGEELLRVVTELGERVGGWRSIREGEGETGYWSRSLPALGQADRQAGRVVRSIPFPLSAWLNTGLGDRGHGDKVLPGAASASPL